MHPLIYALFFLTGAAGLIYQVVWLRVLIRVFGSTVQATSTLVAAFMAGLAFGAWLFGRFTDRSRAPLRWYAGLELAVAATALALPFAFEAALPILRHVHQTAGGGAALAVTRAALAFAILLVPTSFMGGTFPVLTVLATRHDGRLARNVASLYSLNTLGAVTGTLLTGIVLIGIFGENGAVSCAVALNVLVALIALVIHGRLAPVERAEAASPAAAASPVVIPDGARLVALSVFAASGAAALAYEVIWTRQLLWFLGTSVYAFSGMLAIFLTGIALGSATMTKRVEGENDPVGVFGLLEIALGITSVLTLYLLIPANHVFDSNVRWIRYAGGVLAAVALVLPPTLLLGAIFPTAARAYAAGRPDVGAAVGRAYAVNTVGGIVGSIAAGFLLIPWLGTTRAVALLGLVNVIGGVALVAASPVRKRQAMRILAAAVAILALVMAPLLAADPLTRVVRDRLAWKYRHLIRIYWHHEDPAATVTVFATQRPGRPVKKHLWVNGVGMTALVTVTKIMAHLPIMLGPEPAPGGTRKVLVICFGMGTTVRSASRWPDTEVDAVELIPAVYRALPFFHADAAEMEANPRVRLRVGDGRNWLLLSGRKYDVITVDPAPPIWSAGTVNLYSREFMALARDALTEDGVAQFWVSSVVTKQELRMLLATFRSVFPEGTVWSGSKISGYFLIGAKRGPIRVDPARFRGAWRIPAVRDDILEWNADVGTPEKVLALYAAGASRMAAFSGDAPLITDNHPWVEFPIFRYVFEGDRRYPRRQFLARRDPIEEVLVTP